MGARWESAPDAIWEEGPVKLQRLAPGELVNCRGVKLPGLFSQVLDFCYPGRCAACEDGVEGAAVLCEPCDGELRKLEIAPGCTWCGKPIPEVGAPCPHCLGEGITHYDRVVRLGT